MDCLVRLEWISTEQFRQSEFARWNSALDPNESAVCHLSKHFQTTTQVVAAHGNTFCDLNIWIRDRFELWSFLMSGREKKVCRRNLDVQMITLHKMTLQEGLPKAVRSGLPSKELYSCFWGIGVNLLHNANILHDTPSTWLIIEHTCT